MVEDALEEGVRPIRSLGPLIHNAQEMERLGELGVSTIDAPLEADADTIAVIRAHGVTPQVQQDLEGRAAKVIDATCPFVTRVQHLAERAAKDKSPAVRYVIDGKLSNLGSYNRTLTGTWTQGATKGDFKLTRD